MLKILPDQSIPHEDSKASLPVFQLFASLAAPFRNVVLTLLTSPSGETSISSFTPGAPGAYPRTINQVLSKGGTVINDEAVTVGPSTVFSPAESSNNWDWPPDAIISFLGEPLSPSQPRGAPLAAHDPLHQWKLPTEQQMSSAVL